VQSRGSVAVGLGITGNQSINDRVASDALAGAETTGLTGTAVGAVITFAVSALTTEQQKLWKNESPGSRGGLNLYRLAVKAAARID